MSCFPVSSFNPAITRVCGSVMGGIRAVYLATFNSTWKDATADFGNEIQLDRGKTTIAFRRYRTSGYWGIAPLAFQGDTDGQEVIAAIEGIAPLDYVKFYRIDTSRHGAEITSELQDNEDNNSTYFENLLSIPVRGLSPEAVKVINSLLGVSCLAVAETNSGNFIPIGLNAPARISAASLGTGTAPGDRSGETFQIRELSPYLPPVTLVASSDYYGDYDQYATIVSAAEFRNMFVDE